MAKCSSASGAGPRRYAEIDGMIGGIRMSMRIWSASLFCVMACHAASAWPEDLAAARACVQLTGTAARLACYDAAFAAQPGPPANPAPSAASASPAATAPPAASASTASPAASFGDNGQLQQQLKAKAKLPKELQFKVQTAVPIGQGLYRLTLENGQIWETRQADWALEFKSSDTVTISRMVFDTYQISLAGQGRSVGVKRIK
jgi:hypothetical protein